MRNVLVLLAASAAALPLSGAAAAEVGIAASGPVVELSIYESVEAAPDQVTIGAGVTTTAPSATEAMRQNAAEMTKVIARIKALGIAEKDIQTTGIGVAPQYDYLDNGPKFRGYQAANRVSVILRKIEDTGRVLDALVEAGATDLSGPEFSIADDTAAKEQARSRAVARGAAQAKAYAAMLGYDGAKVLSVSESIEFGSPMLLATKGMALDIAAAAVSPVQPGQVSTGVNVTITYELVGKAAAAPK